jgi:hypothetical protein
MLMGNQRLEEDLGTNDMPFIHTDSTTFDQKLRAVNSPSAMGAVDLLKAAFWLLSYPMPAQALLLLSSII